MSATYTTVTLVLIPTTLSPGSEDHAIHDNVAGEINAIAVKSPGVAADVMLIEDSANSFKKKKLLLGSFPPIDGLDSDAFHQSEVGEISGLTEKPAPASDDWGLMEDASGGGAKRSFRLGNLSILRKAEATKVADYTLTNSDYVVYGDCSGANRTFTFPAAPAEKKEWEFVHIGSANKIILDGNGKNISGSPTLDILSKYDSVRIRYDITADEYYIM